MHIKTASSSLYSTSHSCVAEFGRRPTDETLSVVLDPGVVAPSVPYVAAPLTTRSPAQSLSPGSEQRYTYQEAPI